MKGNQMGKSSGPTTPADYAALVKESERFKKLMTESQVLTKHEEELMQEWQRILPEEDFDMLCARWLSLKKWRIWHKPMSEETFMAFCDAVMTGDIVIMHEVPKDKIPFAKILGWKFDEDAS